MMGAPSSRRGVLELLAEAIGRDRHFIARHPAALFQCLWNSCWWYDCPTADAHYLPPDGGWTAEGPPWGTRAPQLSALLEKWREHRDTRFPERVWIRSIRPPIIPLGVGLISLPAVHGNEDILVANSKSVGLTFSNQSGVQAGLGYMNNSIVSVPTHAQSITEIKTCPIDDKTINIQVLNKN